MDRTIIPHADIDSLHLNMKDHLSLKVAIASGKGGTGKTLVSVNLFSVLMF